MGHMHLGDARNHARLHTADFEELLITLRDVGPLPEAARPLVLQWIDEHQTRVPYYLGLSEELLCEEAAREGLREAVKAAETQLSGPRPSIPPSVLHGGREPGRVALRLALAAQELAAFLDHWAEGTASTTHQEAAS